MTKDTKITCYWLIGIFFIGTITLYFMGYSKYNKGENLYKNRGYAVGTLVLNNGPSHGRYSSTSPVLYFNFNTENKEMKNIESIGYEIVSWKEGIVGDQYLVIYDKTDPENAIILLDYPIKDITTFNQYLEEFKVKPLNITPYFRMGGLFFLKDYSN